LEDLNIVEISENSAQIEDKRILKSIKKGIIEKEEDEKEFSISFSK